MAPILRFIVLFVALGLALPAHAQFNFLPEVRAGLGIRGVEMPTAPDASLLDPQRISDINAELLFTVPDLNAWSVLGELRPHLGTSVSFRNQDSYGYAGLSWTFQAPILPVFAEVAAGGVVRSSLFTAPDGDPSRTVGCGVGLRAAGSVGINLPLGTSLIGTVEHLPDFGTCGTPARANTNLSLKVGFRF